MSLNYLSSLSHHLLHIYILRHFLNFRPALYGGLMVSRGERGEMVRKRRDEVEGRFLDLL